VVAYRRKFRYGRFAFDAWTPGILFLLNRAHGPFVWLISKGVFHWKLFTTGTNEVPVPVHCARYHADTCLGR